MSDSQAKGRFHFIGIGGIGMSALAKILVSRGFVVSGSDLLENAITRELAEQGVSIETAPSSSFPSSS